MCWPAGVIFPQTTGACTLGWAMQLTLEPWRFTGLPERSRPSSCRLSIESTPSQKVKALPACSAAASPAPNRRKPQRAQMQDLRPSRANVDHCSLANIRRGTAQPDLHLARLNVPLIRLLIPESKIGGAELEIHVTCFAGIERDSLESF